MMGECSCESASAETVERRSLWLLLAINATLFVAELLAGWLGESTGLLADSLDMLADAIVYGLALSAVGRSHRRQIRAAWVSGLFQGGLGLAVLGEVLRRARLGSEPISVLMMGMGGTAFAANLTCLAILARHRNGGVHMRASWIFSTNDVLANLGVIVSGGLVWWLDSPLPDLVIGVLISALVIHGGCRILSAARRSARSSADAPVPPAGTSPP